jgi:hypothetical protein
MNNEWIQIGKEAVVTDLKNLSEVSSVKLQTSVKKRHKSVQDSNILLLYL